MWDVEWDVFIDPKINYLTKINYHVRVLDVRRMTVAYRGTVELAGVKRLNDFE
jgi:hypothetical protein